MPQESRKQFVVRMPTQQLVLDFETAARVAGIRRGTVVRQFIQRFIREHKQAHPEEFEQIRKQVIVDFQREQEKKAEANARKEAEKKTRKAPAAPVEAFITQSYPDIAEHALSVAYPPPKSTEEPDDSDANCRLIAITSQN